MAALVVVMAVIAGRAARKRADARRAAMTRVEAARAELAFWLSDARFVVHVSYGREWEVIPPGAPPRTPPSTYAVTYRGGPLVALVGRGARQPPKTPYLSPSSLPIPPLPGPAALAEGARRVEVRLDASPRGGMYHRVSLTNRGATPVRVRWFGAWSRGAPPEFDTVTGRPFTGEDFRLWYAVPDPEGWIAPGQTVDDPVSYGGALWVWELETADGESFVVGVSR